MSKPEQASAAKSLTSGRSGFSTFWFASTTLLGAFLVFQVQPVISKCVLPWFGGTPAVWTTCMLFFQVLLFAGYLYAHFLRSFLRPAMQGVVHLGLLAAAALALPIEPTDAWKPTGQESPMLHLLWMLTAHVGLPYFVLSSTGPLIQAWLSYQDDSDRVYRLYALSNAGSLAALLSYPFLVEPVLSVTGQSIIWSLMFCLFVLFEGVIATRLIGHQPPASETKHETSRRRPNDVATSWKTRAAWIALPALASTTLLVVTNHVCQDIAVIPFLWVLPLSLYLLSFIICFDSPTWYKPKWIAGATMIAILTIQAKHVLPGPVQLIAEASCYMLTLLGVCLLCHGEVARIKPRASELTRYYAMLSAGGAIGGIVVALICPLIFDTFLELPLTLGVVTALTCILFFACQGWRETRYDWSAIDRLKFPAIALMLAPLLTVTLAPQDETVASERNFFGVLAVIRNDVGVRLVHGSTIHGMQRHGEFAGEPTTYYGRESGVGLAIAEMQQRHPSLRVGVVGLGCGVLATYGRSTDRFDLIEINPAVTDIAETHFSFLRNSDADLHHHLGDGRLVLERMDQVKFDLLVLDAFSSDAIPAHLLTREAIALYQARLKPNGVLAVHVSNNHLDLAPLVHRLADDAGWDSRMIRGNGKPAEGIHPSIWVLAGNAQHPIWQTTSLESASSPTAQELADAPLWTDQHHNLVSVLRLW